VLREEEKGKKGNCTSGTCPKYSTSRMEERKEKSKYPLFFREKGRKKKSTNFRPTGRERHAFAESGGEEEEKKGGKKKKRNQPPNRPGVEKEKREKADSALRGATAETEDPDWNSWRKGKGKNKLCRERGKKRKTGEWLDLYSATNQCRAERSPVRKRKKEKKKSRLCAEGKREEKKKREKKREQQQLGGLNRDWKLKSSASPSGSQLQS